MSLALCDTKELCYASLQVAVTRFGASLNNLSEDKRNEAHAIALKQYEIQSRILASEEARGVSIANKQVDEAVKQIIARYPDKDTFLKELDSYQLDMSSLRYSVDRELRVEAVMDVVATHAIESSDTDARLYYYLHPDKFTQPETRDAKHILITNNPQYPENSRERAIERASAIASRLRKKPARFSEQALKNSECPTAMNGGQLGRVKRGTLYAELDDILFKMKAGQISDVVESPIGFHVLLCEKIYPAGLIPINEALPKIVEKINERNRKKQQRRWLSKLMSA